MMDVDMDENSIQSREEFFAVGAKILWKRCSDLNRKDRFIVDDCFNPLHQEGDVIGSTQ